MATSRADEFRSRLARWEEEFQADPKKTEITQWDMTMLQTLINKVENAEKKLREAEEEVVEYLHS